MIRYEGTIWRPPSEAHSLILQATIGCSHNACTFCVSYKDRKYRVRGATGIKKDLQMLPDDYKTRVKRVFLADGNALSMTTDELLKVLNILHEEMPRLERVGVYGYAKDVRGKSISNLQDLHNAGLGIVYLGLETGYDKLLRWSRKGVKNEENISASLKIREAGIPLSLTIILGLGGLENSKRHAIATADALNAIDPEYVGALTLMIPRGTPLHELVQEHKFKPMNAMEILIELRTLVNGLELTNCIFRTNHASNYLPLGGTLNRDKRALLDVLDEVIESGNKADLRPEYYRGL